MNNLYTNKKVLIFGLGLNQGGVGSAKFFAQNGAEVRITDLKSEKDLQSSLDQLAEFKNISYTLGVHKFEDIDWADLIIKNPAIKPGNKYIEYALEKNKQIETDFSIFLQYANQKKLIAITGTKGKTTTVSLIFEALRIDNQQVVLVGNIGKSILDTLTHTDKDPWIIVEISSFQLQALKGKNFSPKIAVITNIYPDHLNWHSSMEKYIQAKKIIALGQTSEDFLVLPCQGILHSEQFQQDIKSQIVEFCAEDFNEDFPNIDLPLKGLANLENYATALTVTGILKIDDQKVLQAFQNFKGARFRMQEIGVFNGIKIINDSTSTNPISTIEALKTLGPGVILIAGGMNKGMQYHELAAQIENYTPVKSLYLLEGDATKELTKYLRNPAITKGGGLYNGLETLLKEVKKEAKPGNIILFSPAATSFNLFQNEFDRGERFNRAVEKVFGASIS